jgi:hypothetical protein
VSLFAQQLEFFYYLNVKKVIFSNDSKIDVIYTLDKVSNFECIEFSMCVFSTGFNRNHAYFQVSKLLEYREKLSRLLSNINHSDKYLKNLTKYSNIRGEFKESNLEIWVDVKSTDPELIKYKDEITAPSIELLVEEKNLISSKNGEYFIDFDWVAISYLTGIPAGCGDARIESIRQYDYNFNNKNNMKEEEIKKLLEEQENKLKAEFKAENEKIIIEFNKKIAEENTENKGEYTYINDKGETIKTSWKSIYLSLTEILENEEIKEDSPLILMMKAKNFKLVKEEKILPKTKEEIEIENANESVIKAEEFAAKMKTVRTDEELNKVSKPAETKENFSTTLKKMIAKKF